MMVWYSREGCSGSTSVGEWTGDNERRGFIGRNNVQDGKGPAAAAAAARRRFHAPTTRGRRGAGAHHRDHRKSGFRRCQPSGGLARHLLGTGSRQNLDGEEYN